MPLTPSPLILADPSPCLRWLALMELFSEQAADADLASADAAALAAARADDPLVRTLVEAQETDGSWDARSLGYHWGTGSRLIVTAQALYRLGYLGFDASFPAVEKAAGYLFGLQREDGSWPLPREGQALDGHMMAEQDEGYSMIPLQTAFPLRGLAACGYAGDARAERAYEWLLAQRLPDGAWPTGMASGVHGYVAGYRRLAHSRWGCRSNTTGALMCFALHPQRRHSAEARRALDLLLGRETREEYALGFEVARLVGAEEVRGFMSHFARFDAGLILDLCWRLGASQDDVRVAELTAFVDNARGPYGLWEYAQRPQASRWVSFDLTRSRMRLEDGGAWVGAEPRTPFQPYGKRRRRF